MSKYRMTKADAKAFEALARWAATDSHLHFSVIPSVRGGVPWHVPWHVCCKLNSSIRGMGVGKTFAAAARRALEAAQ